MADVHLKHAMYLEDNGRFNEAEVEFVNAGAQRGPGGAGLGRQARCWLDRRACLVGGALGSRRLHWQLSQAG
jgi:hypothetical protein